MSKDLKTLEKLCKIWEVEELTYPVLGDLRFAFWSGSGFPEHHHYGDGGLCRHTMEVAMYACRLAEAQDKFNKTKTNIPEIVISTVWHDYGKIWDYQKQGVWGKYNTHSRQIHHISRSAMEFAKHYDIMIEEDPKLASKEINKDNIIHNILAHHGSREWGSPVAPATKEAWLVHLADMTSARMNDCDKHDILNH